jgi:hypothetical protein
MVWYSNLADGGVVERAGGRVRGEVLGQCPLPGLGLLLREVCPSEPAFFFLPFRFFFLRLGASCSSACALAKFCKRVQGALAC